MNTENVDYPKSNIDYIIKSNNQKINEPKSASEISCLKTVGMLQYWTTYKELIPSELYTKC